MVRLSDLSREIAAAYQRLPLPTFEGTPSVTAPPLSSARVGIVSTAGLHRESDAKFGGGHGDYRLIPGDIDSRELVMSHVSVNFDRSGFQQDVNVVFPLEHLQAMAGRGEVGSVARWHYSFMGATDPGRMQESGEQVGRLLKQDGVTAALLIPV